MTGRWLAAVLLAPACLFPDLDSLGSEAEDAAGVDGASVDGASVDSARDSMTSDVRPADGGADAATPCPAGRGPSMVLVADGFGSFCIDTTEVTTAQYGQMNTTPAFGPECAWKNSATTPVAENDDLPVTNVDWCDAFAFCAWAGKRLCGSRNGVTIDDYGPADDASVAEWFAACSHAGALAYPYGNAFNPTACNGCDRTGSCSGSGAPLVAAGSLPGCVGGVPGVFDLSGNVEEWTSDCSPSGTPANDTCPALGGSRQSGAGSLTCAITSSNGDLLSRSQVRATVGFRCCADAGP